MEKSLKQRPQKAWLPPGTLIHVGEKRGQQPSITIMDYNEKSLIEKKVREVQECFPFRTTDTTTWIDIEGLQDIPLLEKLGSCFGIHPLILEDILNTDQRPKFDEMETYLYVVLKMLNYDDKKALITTEQVSLILGDNFVLSLQEGFKDDAFNPVRERIRSGKGRLRKMGPDYLAYALLDGIIDNYFVVLEKIGERIELIEDEMIEEPGPHTVKNVHQLKRDMLFLRKSLWPLREVIGALNKESSSLIKDSTFIYLRDLHDHIIQVIDTIETYRELISGILDIYLSSMSNRMNQVMKVLTIIATIFIPLTFIAGVYGMNFRFMPELDWQLGYPLILGLMLAVALVMVAYFKKKNWM